MKSDTTVITQLNHYSIMVCTIQLHCNVSTFSRVADQHEVNKMTADNLAVVFAPTLMRSNNELSAFADLSQQRKLVEFLILNYHEIF